MKAFKNKSEDFKLNTSPYRQANENYGLLELRVKKTFCVSQGRCVCLYNVMGAILNYLHILKNTQGFTSGTRCRWIWISTSILTKSRQIRSFCLCLKNKGDVFVYDVDRSGHFE